MNRKLITMLFVLQALHAQPGQEAAADVHRSPHWAAEQYAVEPSGRLLRLQQGSGTREQRGIAPEPLSSVLGFALRNGVVYFAGKRVWASHDGALSFTPLLPVDQSVRFTSVTEAVIQGGEIAVAAGDGEGRIFLIREGEAVEVAAPRPGTVTALAADPQRNGSVLAGYGESTPPYRSVYRVDVNTGAVQGLGLDEGVTALALEPGDSRHVFAGTPSGLMESHDSGMNWTLAVSGAVEDVRAFGSVESFALEVTRPGAAPAVSYATSSCKFTVTPTEINVDANRHVVSIRIDANSSTCAWTASEGHSWMSIDDHSGRGDQTIKLTISENNGNPRTGSNVKVAGRSLVVRQAAKPPAPAPPSGGGGSTPGGGTTPGGGGGGGVIPGPPPTPTPVVTTTSFQNVTGSIGAVVPLKAVVTFNPADSFWANGNVRFTVNGAVIGSVSVNSGVAVINYKLPAVVGSLPVVAEFSANSGNSVALPSKAQGTVTVNKAPVKLTIEAPSLPPWFISGPSVRVSLVRATDGTALANRRVAIDFNGLPFGSVVTNADGAGTLSLQLTSVCRTGSFNASFAGDSLYEPGNGTSGTPLQQCYSPQ